MIPHNHLLIIGQKSWVLEVKEILSHLPIEIHSVFDGKEIDEELKKEVYEAVLVDGDSIDLNEDRLRQLQHSEKKFVVVSSIKDYAVVRKMGDSGSWDYIVKPFNHREFISKMNAALYRKHRISCIGGGTGLFTLLMGLKTLSNVLLTSIVSMTDDGGSSGRLRISFGILPPGDIRRSLVALSNAPEFMNDVIQHRFSRGSGLKGHSFGNLFLTALAEIKGSMSEAVKGLGDILNIQGIVVPANITLTKLCAEFEDGTVVKGESKIDLAEDRKPELHVKRLWHEPPTECGSSTYSAIIHSDLVTIGPGDLFTSVITNITVSHIREALSKTKAKKVYICNLMTKPGETFNYDAADHIA